MLAVSALAVGASTVACGGSGDDDAATSTTAATTSTTAATPTLTVLTRNLYLGADLVPLFEATAETLAPVARAVYQQVVDSEVEARLDAVAGEIAGADPDVVALQEATVWRLQAPGAAQPEVVYDFVELLLGRLADLGEPYHVVASVDGFGGGLPVEAVGLVSMQDRDVILLRDASPVLVSDPRSGTYAARLTVPVAGAPIEVVRGWASVHAAVEGRGVLVVATHLEAFDDATRDAQQAELLDLLDGGALPTLLLGDLNSAADGDDPETYEATLAAGFVDVWREPGAERDGDPAGPTCCRDADLLGGTLSSRIDFVLLRGDLHVVRATVVGDDEESSRTPSGRWDSDHAGVLATMTVPG